MTDQARLTERMAALTSRIAHRQGAALTMRLRAETTDARVRHGLLAHAEALEQESEALAADIASLARGSSAGAGDIPAAISPSEPRGTR